MRDGLPDGQRGNPALGHVSLRHDSSQRTGMPGSGVFWENRD
jgi:hypothetical protein